MSHPIQFVHYGCGHSTPVPGSHGGTVDRACQSCATGKNNFADSDFGYVRGKVLVPSVILGYNSPSTRGESQS